MGFEGKEAIFITMSGTPCAQKLNAISLAATRLNDNHQKDMEHIRSFDA